MSDGCAAVVDGRLWLVGGDAGVSILGPAAHKWRESVAEEPLDYDVTNMRLNPGTIFILTLALACPELV